MAAPLLASTLDDLFLLLYRVIGPGRRMPELGPLPEKLPRIAIFICCWQEAAVIRRMLDDNSRAIYYKGDYRIYVGLYPNDLETIEEVQKAAARHSRIRLAVGERPGKSTKADNLNQVYQRMLADEASEGFRFDAVVVHDAEDQIDKDELRMVARALERYAMIQVPVKALPDPPLRVRGIYCEDFAYNHIVELPARAALGGFVPSAGVGTAYRRDVLDRMAERGGGRLFESGSLTEDYESGLLVHRLGYRQLFLPLAWGPSPPTAEHFPAQFWRAVTQRSRWIRGIALQSWKRHRWGRGWEAYWFLHDRKAIALNLLAPVVTVWFGAGLIRWLLGYGGAPWSGSGLMAANLVAGALVWAGRVWATARVYGGAFAAGFPWRRLVAMAVDCCAAFKALYEQSGRAGAGWAKTAHTYPSEQRSEGRITVEEVLECEGVLTGAQVRQARASCPVGRSMAMHLAELGWVGEEAMAEALERQSGLERAGSRHPHLRVSRIFSAGVATRYQLLPLGIEDGELVVGVPYPIGREGLAELRRYTRMKVRLVLMTKGGWEGMARSVL